MDVVLLQGMQSDIEAFSAFSGQVVPIGSPELDKVLGMQAANDLDQEDGEHLAEFLIKLGVEKICVVGLATDFWQVASSASRSPRLV